VERNFGQRSREENRYLSLDTALGLIEAVVRAASPKARGWT
jgi:hypothetical protein